MGRLLLLILLAGVVAYFLPAPAVHNEASIEIDATREKVWEVLADFSELPRWNGATHGLEFATSQRRGVGTELHIPGSPFQHTMRVTNEVAYNRVELAVETDPRLTEDQTIRYSIHPRQNRTLVRFVEEYRVRGGYLGYAVDRALYRPMRASGRAPALANLKRLVETGNGLFVP
jgi:uncharacterized membrane protein